MVRNFSRSKVFKSMVIGLLIIINFYLFTNKAIPGALDSSIDLRYGRATDLLHHVWAGVEEYPSMLFCVLPLAMFQNIKAARIGWLVANVIFLLIVIWGLRKTFFSEMDRLTFAIWSLLFSSSVPVIMTFINGQNLLFAFAFFIMAYVLSENNEKESILFSVLAGIMLGISYFKYSVIFFITPIFIFKKKWREIMVSALMHVILTIFSIFWLKTTLLQIIFSPITSSVGINAGRGYIDLMTIFNSELLSVFPGRRKIVEILASHHSNMLYCVIVCLNLLFIMFIAFFRRNKKEELVFSLFCVLSVVLIYHRQYDYFVLIVPLFYLLKRFKRCLEIRNVVGAVISGIASLGMSFVLWGNWISQLFNVSIEYGIANHIFYGGAIVGVYIACIYLQYACIKENMK